MTVFDKVRTIIKKHKDIMPVVAVAEILADIDEAEAKWNDEWVLAEDGKQPNSNKYCSKYYWVTITRKGSNILITEKLRWIGYMKRWEWGNGRELSSDYEVIAWKEYYAPAPYQKGNENE